jgi:hypothetical protein
MKPLPGIALLLLVASCASSQTCVHTDLSKTLTFVSTVKRKHLDEANDSVRISIRIVDKATGKSLQEITVSNWEFYAEDYSHCRMVRSYSTGKNIKREIIDNDFGDIIVADLNFDSREDLAVKTTNNNGGTDYTFYIQTKDKKFVPDRYLTDSVYSFPRVIDRRRRTITTWVRAGIRNSETIYHLDIRTNRWSRIKRRLF